MAKYSIWDYRNRNLQFRSGAHNVDGLNVCTTAFQLRGGPSETKADFKNEANNTVHLLSFNSVRSREVKNGIAKRRWLAVAQLQLTSPSINGP